jgi:hypothetical protein
MVFFMRKNKDKTVKRVFRRMYQEDIEYVDWLCKINKTGYADMLHNILTVYPQANIETVTKTACEEQSLKK